MHDFLDALVALRLLERDGDGADGALRATRPTPPLSSTSDSPAYIGGILEMANARLYRFWGDLTEALQTGQPQNEVKHTGKPMFDELYSDPARLEQFMDAMAGISAGNFQAFAEKFDFSRYQTLCDVGGATGQLVDASSPRATRTCAARASICPVVEPIAERTIADAGLADRVSVAAGDFFTDPLPEGGRDHDGHDPPRLEPREEEAAPDPQGLRRAARRRRVRRHREPHRRRAPRERVRPADVAQHADRVRRRVRLHRRGLRRLVPRGGLPRRRDPAARRPGQRRRSPTSSEHLVAGPYSL